MTSYCIAPRRGEQLCCSSSSWSGLVGDHVVKVGRRAVAVVALQPFESRSLGEELVHAAHRVEAGEHVAVHALFVVPEELPRPVSYTHLTLPTTTIV